jgi:Bacterial protein of unknown function (DUF899)
MGELRYPNESREYREARDSLLKEEQELVDKVKSVAERRRSLPPGGELKEDYVFQWANDGKVGQTVRFSGAARGEVPLEGLRSSSSTYSSCCCWYPSSCTSVGAPRRSSWINTDG